MRIDKNYLKEVISEIKQALDTDDDDDELDASMAKLIKAKNASVAATAIAAAEHRKMVAEFEALKESNTKLEQSGIDRIIAGQHAITIALASIVPDQKDELLDMARSMMEKDTSVTVTNIGQSHQSGDGSTVTGDTHG